MNPVTVKQDIDDIRLSNVKVRIPLSDMDPAKAEVLKKAMIEYGISL